MTNKVDFLSYKFNEFQCRISNFDDIGFTPRSYKKFVFIHPWKSHALNVRSDSTPMILTLGVCNTLRKSCQGSSQ